MFEEKERGVTPMVLSINLHYKLSGWETCLMEHGHICEFFAWEKMVDLLAYVTQIAARYPTLLLALVTDLETELCSLTDLLAQLRKQDEHEQDRLLYAFLLAIHSLNIQCVHLPAVKYAPGVPRYRQLFFPTMGPSSVLSTLATLLYRMRQQNAAWTEMTFFYLELYLMSYTLVVIKEGSIVDGISVDFEPQLASASVSSEAREQVAQLLSLALWEQLTRDLAGLVAVHHITDIVLLNYTEDAKDVEQNSSFAHQLINQEEAIEQLGDIYTLYLFPQDENEQAGREIVFGAALLTEGLLHHSDHLVELAQKLLSVLFLPS